MFSLFIISLAAVSTSARLLGYWDFEQGLEDRSINKIAGSVDIKGWRKAIRDGDGLHLRDGVFVTTDFINTYLGETKTISSYFTMNDNSRGRGGAVIGIERPYTKAKHHTYDALGWNQWESLGGWGFFSEQKHRYKSFQGSQQTNNGDKILLTLVLDGERVTMYWNTELYGESYITGTLKRNEKTTTYKANDWRIVFGGNSSHRKGINPQGHVFATVHKAWVWDTARTQSQIRSTLCIALGNCNGNLPESCVVTGYVRENNDNRLQLVANVETYTECHTLCMQSDDCEYYDYSKGDKWCRLFKEHGTLKTTSSVQDVYGPKWCPQAQVADTKDVICPFLATLVNEGALSVRNSYSKLELETITVQAGVPAGTVMGHVHGGNFFWNPSGVQNIFDMEGAVNEHKTSTGIHDCETDYSKCPLSTRHDPEGTEKCPGAVTVDCTLPNVGIFDRFWDHTDANDDGFIDLTEMMGDANGFGVIDVNEKTGRGTITGSFQDIIRLMGVDGNNDHSTGSMDNDRMDELTMRRVMIDRRFPAHYSYPYLSGGQGFVQLGDWRMGPVSEGYFFSFSHRNSCRAVVFGADGHYYNGGGDNFRLWDEDMLSGEYPTDVQFGSHMTFDSPSYASTRFSWKIGNIDMSYFSIEKDDNEGFVLKADGSTPGSHGNVISGTASELYFGDRFIQLGNFRLADASDSAFSHSMKGRFMISHIAFKDKGITFLEDGSVVEGIFK